MTAGPSSAAHGGELARAVSVRKAYGDCVAVRDVSCAFRAGEIHAVCGENGAGKSTFLKMVCGLVTPDAGDVLVMGSRLAPHTPQEALARGAAMVLQHFALVPVFTVLENAVLGAEPTRSFGRLDLKAARERLEVIAHDLGADLPWDARVADLGVGDRQRLEIVRALARDARLLVLDEPTAVLTPSEATALYGTLRRLAAAGKGVVVVTHKMDEVRAHADHVTVLRRGATILSRAIDRAGDVKAQVDEVTRAVMGEGRAHREGASAPDMQESIVLDVQQVDVGRALRGVSLRVRAGEIVGLAGIEGNGQRELVGLVAGDVAADAGTVDAAAARAVVREDRHAQGLVLDASLEDNLVLGELSRFGGPLGVLDTEALRREAETRLAASGAEGTLATVARSLSGGNQQKIVVARALAKLGAGEERRLLVLAQPTRGVDLAAAAAIHASIREAARAGAGVLVLSTDLDELRTLASRILVIARGAIVAELPPTASDEDIGRPMLGLAASAAEVAS